MRLAITPGAYLIHGTNNPLAVGMAVTHGCMRMYPEDIEALFPLVPVGTKVCIVNEPVKVAFVDGELLLEVHPPVDAEGQTIEPDLEMFSGLLDQALGPTTAAVHWDFARETMQAANGLPTVVGLEADLDPTPDPIPTPETQIAGSEVPPVAPAASAPATLPPPGTATGGDISPCASGRHSAAGDAAYSGNAHEVFAGACAASVGLNAGDAVPRVLARLEQAIRLPRQRSRPLIPIPPLQRRAIGLRSEAVGRRALHRRAAERRYVVVSVRLVRAAAPARRRRADPGP